MKPSRVLFAELETIDQDVTATMGGAWLGDCGPKAHVSCHQDACWEAVQVQRKP